MIPYTRSDSEVRSNVFKSLILNTVSLVSIYFFDWLLLPLAQSQQKWFHRNLGWFYQVLWLLPVVGISFYLNVSNMLYVPSPPIWPLQYDASNEIHILDGSHRMCVQMR